MVADYLKKEDIRNPSLLVPVPNSDSVVNAGSPRTTGLARAIAKKLTSASQVADVLRFKQKMPSANQQGGTRDPEELYRRLARIDHRFGNEGDFGRPERFSESFAIDPVQVE